MKIGLIRHPKEIRDEKLINSPENVVVESVDGFALAHGDIVKRFTEPLFVARAQKKDQGKVAIVSGGGSGHEPLHAGFVGHGMLDAAVPGAMFTSPTPDAIQAATDEVNAGAGVLYIVKNYTGDVLNFDTAAELAEFDDIEVSQVIVDDDVAVEDSTYTAGRRGVAGAAAERGDDLAAVTAVAKKVVENTATMGAALSACTVPHVGKPSFDLADDEVELGVGIHGEPGRKEIPLVSADDVTDHLMEPILADLKLAEGERTIVVVNGMGATPASELYVVYRRVAQLLEKAGVSIERSLVGNFVTSLDMAGCSVTVMRADDEDIALFDAPCHTAALRQGE